MVQMFPEWFLTQRNERRLAQSFQFLSNPQGDEEDFVLVLGTASPDIAHPERRMICIPLFPPYTLSLNFCLGRAIGASPVQKPQVVDAEAKRRAF
jgi:hypothetical protein